MEVKSFVLAVMVPAAMILFAVSTEAVQFSTCSPGCNVTSVWWNDTVNITGVGTALAAVSSNISGSPACSTTTSATGNWNCTFLAPNDVGTYNLSVAVGASVDSSLLKVKPSYGQVPSGTASRSVLEIPLAMEQPSGRISVILSRLIVSHGGPS